MARFIAEVSFGFESQSVEAAGADLRRLAAAAEDAGFEVLRGKVTPAANDQDKGRTSYAPLEQGDQ